jgi:hypothetical protein
MSRALTAKFRKHVIALPPGSAFEWRDIDAWAEANCPSARQGYDPDDFWAGPPWDDLCVECMVICEEMQQEGYLIPGGASAYGEPWD